MITDLLASIIKEHRMEYEQAPMAYCSNQIKSLAKSVYDKQRKIGAHALLKGFLIAEWCRTRTCSAENVFCKDPK